MDETHQRNASIPTASVSDPSPFISSQRKRSLASSPAISVTEATDNRRKAPKVSRACDLCKIKKAKCTGTRPCSNCTRKNVLCVYYAEYRRGRPPTPPPGASEHMAERRGSVVNRMVLSRSTPCHLANRRAQDARNRTDTIEIAPSRASPDLEMTEIEGQYFDPTSGLTFLHRAWKRLSAQTGQDMPDLSNGAEKGQRLMTAGDKPFHSNTESPLPISDRHMTMKMLEFYFDVCIVTYRLLHRQTVSSWLDAVLSNSENNIPITHGIGHAKSAVVLTILAIVTLRRGKLREAPGDGTDPLRSSQQLFYASVSMTEVETGLPRLESAQARLLQVIYLLQTTRMNQAWYVFGDATQIISALGLHRKAGRKRNGNMSKTSPPDYIKEQCRKRTFWVAYIIDKYLSVVLGRPRYYHDDDIDQDFPDLVNDEDMDQQGSSTSEPLEECYVEALVLHAKLAQIIGKTSREVYSIKSISKQDRVAAAKRLGDELHDWRVSLPPHLGTIRPATLMPSFRRQTIALKLAYSHTIMHANRPFLLGNVGDQSELQDSVAECLSAAKVALETVDAMAKDGVLFHAFWWTSYVAFCALSVVYVWEIQQGSSGNPIDAVGTQSLAELSDLAERCQSYLAQETAMDSPDRRYSIILEELRLEVKHLSSSDGPDIEPESSKQRTGLSRSINSGTTPTENSLLQIDSTDLGDLALDQGQTNLDNVCNPFSEWETTDWLDLDSSAFGPFFDFNGSPVYGL